MPPHELISHLRQVLHSHADENYRRFASTLIPGETRLLGVRIPHVRQLARRIAKEEDWRSILRSPAHNSSFEELLLRSMLPGYATDTTCEERLQWLERELPHLTNWSLCDSCSATCHFVVQHREKAFALLQRLALSTQEFEARFGIVMFLHHYITDASWANRIATILPQVPHGAYYTDMAVAWCSCEIIIKHPTIGNKLLPSLAPSIQKLTLKKIRESHRLPKQT